MTRNRPEIEGRILDAFSVDPWGHARDLWDYYGDPSGLADCISSGLVVPDDLRRLIARLLTGEQNKAVKAGHRGREEALFMFRRRLLSRHFKRKLLAMPKKDRPFSGAEQSINEQVASIVSVLMRDEVSSLELNNDARKRERISAETVKRDTKELGA